MRTDDIGIHAGEMVVDVVLLLVRVSLASVSLVVEKELKHILARPCISAASAQAVRTPGHYILMMPSILKLKSAKDFSPTRPPFPIIRNSSWRDHCILIQEHIRTLFTRTQNRRHYTQARIHLRFVRTPDSQLGERRKRA